MSSQRHGILELINLSNIINQKVRLMAGAHEVGFMTCSYCVECDESWVCALCVVSGIIGKFYDTVPRTPLNTSPENNLEVKYFLRNQEKRL
jgi:hypothetical protein